MNETTISTSAIASQLETIKVRDRNDEKRNRTQTRVTSKGLGWLGRLYFAQA